MIRYNAAALTNTRVYATPELRAVVQKKVRPCPASSRADAAFALLEQAADSGARCPTNQEIADRLGLASTSRPARILKTLEDRGLIRVERFEKGRVVTILATGNTTAAPSNTKPWERG